MKNLNNYLSSYQNPEGELKDRLAPRVLDRLKYFNWDDVRGKTVLDLGCNNGMFVREAVKHGATRAVGVDISDCIVGARKLAEKEGLKNTEFWQTSLDSKEFRELCPKFDVVFCLSVITHVKDKEEFLDWLDKKVGHIMYFESNHGEPNKKHIELVKKYIWFDEVKYLGKTDVPEKPHYMWRCLRVDHELRYPIIKKAPIRWLPIDKLEGVDEKTILEQDTTYSIKSDKFKKLKESIKKRGIREPIIVTPKLKGRLVIFQGGHRYLAAKELGYKDIPCKLINFYGKPRLNYYVPL